MKFKLSVAGILIALLLVFALQNNETVTVWFLFWQITGSRALVLVLTFILGCIAGGLMGMQFRRRQPPTSRGAMD